MKKKEKTLNQIEDFFFFEASLFQAINTVNITEHYDSLEFNWTLA